MLTCPPSKLNKVPNNYSIQIFSIFLESWRQTKGLKKIYWNGFFLIFVAAIVPTLFLLSLSLLLDGMYPSFHLIDFLMDIPHSIFYLISGISLSHIALQHIRGKSVHYEMALDLDKIWKSLVFFGFIVYLLLFMINLWLLYISTLSANSTVYGFQIIFECIFFTIITIYIFQLAIITMLLILDKNLTQMKSFAICFKAINKHCFKNISLGLFTWFLAIFFTILTLGIGLIWLQPMLSLTHAIQYQRIFNEGDSVI